MTNHPVEWARTVLIVTFDQHGGFYDHVPPPVAANPDGIDDVAGKPGSPAEEGFNFDHLGVRVPAIVASPLVTRGQMDSHMYEHTSILATMKKMFALPKFLTKRDANAGTFEALFVGPPRTDTPKSLK